MMFFHLLALVLTYCSYAYGDCPSGAIQGNNPDECYIVVDTPTTWQTAEESCQALGGHLTSIVNAFQNSFLLSKIHVILSRYNDAWIGANTLTYPGTWTWTDNSSWIYSNWASGYPTGSKNLCGAMGTVSGRWYSFNCANDIHPYACGVPGTGQGQTTKSNPPSPPPVKTTANPPPPVKTTTNPPSPSPITTTGSLPGRCPNGYVYNSGFNFCYKFYNLPGYTYFQAEAVCKQYGGHLVSVHTDDENNYLNYLASDLQNAYMWASDFWIGAVYTNENVWAWDDGTNFDYSNWYQSTYEDCSCESCAAYTNGVSYDDYKQWDTVQCDRTDLGGFICKNKPSF